MRILKKPMLAVACLALSACAPEASEQQPEALTPVVTGKFLRSPEAVSGQYIVVLKDAEVGKAQVPMRAQALATRHGAAVTLTYAHALRGFVVRADERGARALAQEPEVDYVVEDGRAEAIGTQSGATWGLDRVDQRDRPLNGSYTYDSTGAGVHAYIIDSGILTSHSDFGGRATGDFTAINDGRGAGDCHGHGTHVAGTVGGATWGVAKGVRLHSVRVFDCTAAGTWSAVIAGVDWVTGNHIKPAVANMSLGGGANQAVDDAVRRSIKAGVVYALAAGNESTDACTRSPARTGEALTVGATDSSDTRASYSNYGACVDLFAPGDNITSASVSGGTTGMSGTSMAAPHVAGAAALYLERHPSALPVAVNAALLSQSSTGKVANVGPGSPNRLLHSRVTPPACGTLFAGQSLAVGQPLSACSGRAALIHQDDGNVVVYDRQGALWATNTSGRATSSFVMQGDGNLVLYANTGAPLWNSRTAGHSGARVTMQDDCNLVVYNAGGQAVWSSGTFCR